MYDVRCVFSVWNAPTLALLYARALRMYVNVYGYAMMTMREIAYVVRPHGALPPPPPHGRSNGCGCYFYKIDA